MGKSRRISVSANHLMGRLIVAFMKGTGARLSSEDVKALAPLVMANIPRPNGRKTKYREKSEPPIR